MAEDAWAGCPSRPGVDPASLPLADIDPANPDLFRDAAWEPWFARLRREAPVHHCARSTFGPYWSVTRFRDILQVEREHAIFSSRPTVLIGNPPKDFRLHPGFIAMDPPEHTAYRHAAMPAVAPASLELLEPLVRGWAAEILDGLPRDGTFDWVERVAVELTSRMLATLFGFPPHERSRLTRWSDVATSSPRGTGSVAVTEEGWRAEMLECLQVFTRLREERAGAAPAGIPDFPGLLANDPATRGMSPFEYLGNVLLLIVAANDTTRNAIAGGVLALNRFPREFERLRADPGLVATLVPEIIRWQTPLAYMRRTATRDTELAGQRIRAGEKVLLWYISGNRDETEIERPDDFVIDRPRARRHLAFGAGVHRCMGARLAEMQLRILWEEILARFRGVELCGEPVRVRSSFVHGFERMPVRVLPV